MNTPPNSTRPDPEDDPEDTLAPRRPPSFDPLRPLKPQGMTFNPSRPTPTSPDR
jgi:hypothetical protein